MKIFIVVYAVETGKQQKCLIQYNWLNKLSGWSSTVNTDEELNSHTDIPVDRQT
jgi:hypothetical protein